LSLAVGYEGADKSNVCSYPQEQKKEAMPVEISENY
jgi:hypothetical protein